MSHLSPVMASLVHALPFLNSGQLNGGEQFLGAGALSYACNGEDDVMDWAISHEMSCQFWPARGIWSVYAVYGFFCRFSMALRRTVVTPFNGFPMHP